MNVIKEKIYRPLIQVGLGNYIRLKKNKVSFQRLLLKGKVIIKNNNGVVKIGKNSIIHSGVKANVLGVSSGFEIYPNARLLIGDGVCMSNTRIRCQDEIRVDDNVMIGGGVTIMDSNCHSLDYNERMFSLDGGTIISAPIHIKKGAFIGAGTFILKGVTIGEKAIVAAGSVISKDIPDGEIWGGNPAAFLRKV